MSPPQPAPRQATLCQICIHWLPTHWQARDPTPCHRVRWDGNRREQPVLTAESCSDFTAAIAVVGHPEPRVVQFEPDAAESVEQLQRMRDLAWRIPLRGRSACRSRGAPTFAHVRARWPRVASGARPWPRRPKTALGPARANVACASAVPPAVCTWRNLGEGRGRGNGTPLRQSLSCLSGFFRRRER